MNNDRLEYLFNLYLGLSATKEEEQELMQMLADPANEEVVKSLVGTSWEQWRSKRTLPEEHSVAIYNNLLHKINSQNEVRDKRIISPAFGRLAVAATLFVLLGLGIYFAMHEKRQAPPKTVIASTERFDVAPPSGSHAILTLANGRKVILDSAGEGTLVSQGNVKITKLTNGQITYLLSGSHAAEPLYNTLTVPRGSKIMQLTLADGSKVWLNSASSLRYPASFTGKERKVEVAGEAYFEIAPDASRPFLVSVNGMEVQVLGTRFNINAYQDEASVKTTLLEGSIQVKKGPTTQMLVPGQQVLLNTDGQLTLIKNANAEEAIAWKNGFFSFHDAGIQEVMRQLSRWYDVDVSYEGGIPSGSFSGEIGRNLSLQNVCNILKRTRVNFKIEANKKIIIMP